MKSALHLIHTGKGRVTPGSCGCIQLSLGKCNTARTWALGLWRHIYLNSALNQESSRFCWMFLILFLHVHKISLISLPDRSSCRVKILSASCCSPDRKSIQKPSFTFGLRASSPVQEPSNDKEPICSPIHNTQVVKTTVERRNDPQSNWTGSYKYSRAMESWTYSTQTTQHHSTCSSSESKTAFRCCLGQGWKQKLIQNWFQLLVHPLHHPVLQFLSLPTPLSLSPLFL